MTPRRDAPAQGDPWAPYEPTPQTPWNRRRVVHLHRRAGFAATLAEVDRDLRDGPGPSIDRVLTGTAQRDRSAEEFEATANLLADAAVGSGDINRLRAWWVFRMLTTPDPLGERLTLLWHGHFATAQSKVGDLALIRRQVDTHRRLARAPFGDLLHAALREPALLVYLDAPSNRRGHPNENLARELMELFTLGIGPYSEADVREAARALTGWTVADGAFLHLPARHDDGVKTILGRTGSWDGADLLTILLDHPATAHRLAGRLCDLLMGEGAIDAGAVDSLAAILRGSRLNLGEAVATILRSRAFFAPSNLGTRVVGPVEFVTDACRAFVPASSVPSTLLLADWIGRLGQALFEPPNVGGWPGGRAWLTPRSVVARVNFAAALVAGRPVGLPCPLDAQALGPSAGAVRRAATNLLLGTEPPDAHSDLDPSPEAARRALAGVLAAPEAQLG